MASYTINGENVIGVVFGLEIKNQGWVSVHPQSSGRKNRAFEAMCSAFLQNAPRRPGSVGKMIRQVLKKSLNAIRVAERPKLA